ncbi:MAG: hypothetical protein BJ554DRAFT_995 [Olpidium bornovanus]|uniref:Uncharacterized protein n=1 Tax=Olpidium bornovanus TaxID=278681 RepID=A0A8H7ZSC7_9FUNG|nr:MAG: hypothetical protein BJ554DRAFT_995 [Olpidium bornovanus]
MQNQPGKGRAQEIVGVRENRIVLRQRTGTGEPVAADVKRSFRPMQVDELFDKIQKLLTDSQGGSKGWEQTVAETLQGLAARNEETMWPRDTLFKYFQLMENLQKNEGIPPGPRARADTSLFISRGAGNENGLTGLEEGERALEEGSCRKPGTRPHLPTTSTNPGVDRDGACINKKFRGHNRRRAFRPGGNGRGSSPN